MAEDAIGGLGSRGCVYEQQDLRYIFVCSRANYSCKDLHSGSPPTNLDKGLKFSLLITYHLDVITDFPCVMRKRQWRLPQ